MKRTLVTFAVLAATIAAAQTVTNLWKTEKGPRDFQSEVLLEQRLVVNKLITADGGCLGCQTGIGSTTYDFPALGSVAGAVTCAESWAVTVPGAAIGDGCQPSTNLGADGGAVLLTEAALFCRATAGGAVLKLCAWFTDAGSYDLGDAGFTARTFR